MSAHGMCFPNAPETAFVNTYMYGSQNPNYVWLTPNSAQLPFPGFAYNTFYNSLPVQTIMTKCDQLQNKARDTSGTFQGNFTQFPTWHSPVPFQNTVGVSDNMLPKTLRSY